MDRRLLLRRWLLESRLLESRLLREACGRLLPRMDGAGPTRARLTWSWLHGRTLLPRTRLAWSRLSRPRLTGALLRRWTVLSRRSLRGVLLCGVRARLRAVLLVHPLHGRRLHEGLLRNALVARRRLLFAPRLLRARVVPPVRHALSSGTSRHPTNARRALVSRKSTVAA